MHGGQEDRRLNRSGFKTIIAQAFFVRVSAITSVMQDYMYPLCSTNMPRDCNEYACTVVTIRPGAKRTDG